MVNNNGIPIEVKKPFETVYEIKDETPSFEEFMKSYENDGNLNYDDLSGGSLGESKGYGPCGWHNPKCTCYIPSGYIPLNCSCPACGDTTPHQWVHRYCEGQMYISTSARIKCMKCDKELKWDQWGFKCCNVNHTGYWRAESGKALLTALTIATGMNADDPRVMRMIAQIGIELLKDGLN